MTAYLVNRPEKWVEPRSRSEVTDGFLAAVMERSELDGEKVAVLLRESRRTRVPRDSCARQKRK